MNKLTIVITAGVLLAAAMMLASVAGATGRGDGPAAQGLVPAPANLTALTKTRIASDAYLDWTISEGGVPVQSAMPPYKAALSKDDVWKLMLYLRTL